jgi:hypothetical protein
MINTNIKTLSKFRVLRRLLLFKIQKEWNNEIYNTLKEIRIRKQLEKYQDTPPTPAQIIHLGDSVYGVFTKFINQAKDEKLGKRYHGKEELRTQKSRYHITESWLKEFMGKSKKRSKHINETFQETICFYIGFTSYAEFERLYDIYLKMYSVHEAFSIFATLSSEGGKNQWNKLIEEYNKQITDKVPQTLQKQYTIDIEKAKAEITDVFPFPNKPIQQWTIGELIQVVLKQKEKLSWFHHVMILDTQEYETTEYLELGYAYKERLLVLVSVVLLLFVVSGLTYFFSQPSKPKPRFSHIYTPAEIAQIQFKILDKDIGINQSSFKIYYDFGKLPKPDTLIISGQGGNGGSHWEITPKHLTKSKDTVRVLFYKPITHIMLDVRQPTLQTLKKILMPTPSSGWIAWTYGMNPITTKDNWVSSYRPTCQILQKGMMYYNPEGLSKTQKDYYHTDYVNSRDFGIKGEECTAEVRLKCPPKIAEGSCMGYGLSLIGEENDINFAPIQAGCSYYLGTKVGHTSYHNSYDVVRYEKGKLITTQPFVGDIAGLTPLVSITEDWHTWKVQIKQGKAYYYLNDKLVYQFAYQGKIGRIWAFHISFKGSGTVDFVRLRNEKEEEVYFEGFEDCKKPAKVKRNL